MPERVFDVKGSDFEPLVRMDSLVRQRQCGGELKQWFKKGLERNTALVLEKF